ncbi:MAG TPA: hypothetical protein VFM46_16075, partial [Pseudomonadales bacterium]|nr:hypothetical protein [Pseudomonadales bacterium]
GASTSSVDLGAYNFNDIKSIDLNSEHNVIFSATRKTKTQTFRGAYGTKNGKAPYYTLREELVDGVPLEGLSSVVSISENGYTAFSTVLNGAGGIYRGDIGTTSVLIPGSGTFYNNNPPLAVNNSGEIALSMEYFDPTMGLTKGIPVFSTQNQTTATLYTAIEKAGIGANSRSVDINNFGQVAFSINGSVTMKFYDPPDNASGTLIKTITLEPGVYIAKQTPFGQPKSVKKVAGQSGPYERFGRVRINDSGRVVFEATTDAGKYGIYWGPDAVTNKIIEVGDTYNGELFSWVRLGGLNNNGQMTMITSDFYSTDRQIWRVDGL